VVTYGEDGDVELDPDVATIPSLIKVDTHIRALRGEGPRFPVAAPKQQQPAAPGAAAANPAAAAPAGAKPATSNRSRGVRLVEEVGGKGGGDSTRVMVPSRAIVLDNASCCGCTVYYMTHGCPLDASSVTVCEAAACSALSCTGLQSCWNVPRETWRCGMLCRILYGLPVQQHTPLQHSGDCIKAFAGFQH
jgi:hypothetical protein